MTTTTMTRSYSHFFSCEDALWELIKDNAKRKDTSVSKYIRDAVLQRMLKEKEGGKQGQEGEKEREEGEKEVEKGEKD